MGVSAINIINGGVPGSEHIKYFHSRYNQSTCSRTHNPGHTQESRDPYAAKGNCNSIDTKMSIHWSSPAFLTSPLSASCSEENRIAFFDYARQDVTGSSGLDCDDLERKSNKALPDVVQAAHVTLQREESIIVMLQALGGCWEEFVDSQEKILFVSRISSL